MTEEDVQSYELWLLAEATHRGYRSLHNRLLTDIELLARLQHHGAATRLIDASRSVLVALWFAVSSDENVAGALIGIHSAFVGGYEGQLETRDYSEFMDAIGKYDHPFTWEPTTVSSRVAVQHSQFLLSRVAESPSGSLCIDRRSDAALIVAISPQLKAVARQLLVEVFDIRTVTLFPDIDGFARANSHGTPQGDMHRW